MIATFKNDFDVAAASEEMSGGSTIILEGNVTNLTMPPDSTLVFRGGVVTGTLVGDNTTLVAPPVRIFGDAATVQGAFTNVCAYSEWWGALPSLSKPASNDKRQNCRDAIQKAIDSVFPEVHFCKGYYYLSAVEELDKDEALAEENDGEPEDDAAGLQEPVSLLVMSKPKSLILSGHGRLGDGVNPFSAATVLWTDENINLLLVDIQTDKQECYPFVIEGGEFNVSECKGFTKSVLLIYPYKLTQVRIATTLIGPIPIKRRAGGVMGWDSNYPHPTTEMVDGGYKGYGIRFTTDPSLSEKRKEPASCIFTTIDSSIFGFGHGLAIDYNPEVDDMTSTVLKGFMDNCFRYVYAPSRAFNGGTIECAIQTRDVNALDGFPEAIIQGNMQEAYLNPMIWDANDGVNLFKITEGNRMRFGQRALDRMCHHSKSAGMTDDFPSGHPVSGDSANNSDSDEPVIGGEVDPLSVSMPTLASSVAKPTENDNWEQGVRGLAAVMSSDSGAVAGALGNFDLNALSAVNARVQSANYLHVVDNDLLSIDAVEKGYEIHVEQNGLEGIYSNYVAGIWKPGTSPFDRDGMVFAFLNDDDVNSANLPNARIEVTITFPKYGSRSFQFLAFHLKSATYFYFENLKIMSHYDLTTTKENGQTVISNYTETLFDGPYADVPQQDGYRDIILPFLFNSRTKRIFPKKLTVIFSGLVRKSKTTLSPVWNSAGNQETFKFSIEGRFNRHFNHQVLTASGGSLGKPLTKLGKFFLAGTETYPNLQALPADAASGAMATVGGDTALDGHPVMKTPGGWMVQHLTASLAKLYELKTQIGEFTKGQSAFANDLLCPLWWNGEAWIDVMGSAVSADEADAPD